MNDADRQRLIEHAREQQRLCAEHLQADPEHAGARLGLFDWMTEELLLSGEVRL